MPKSKMVKAQPWQWSKDGSCPADCADREYPERKVKYDHFRSTEPRKVQKKHPKVKTDSPKLVNAIRAEIVKREKLIAAKRAKMGIPNPSFKPIVKKGKVIGFKSLITPKQRAELHKLAFTAEQIRQEFA